VYESLLISGLPNSIIPPACQFQKDIVSMVNSALTTLYRTQPELLTVLLKSFAEKAIDLQ
jgi:hypothetical protein